MSAVGAVHDRVNEFKIIPIHSHLHNRAYSSGFYPGFRARPTYMYFAAIFDSLNLCAAPCGFSLSRQVSTDLGCRLSRVFYKMHPNPPLPRVEHPEVFQAILEGIDDAVFVKDAS